MTRFDALTRVLLCAVATLAVGGPARASAQLTPADSATLVSAVAKRLWDEYVLTGRREQFQLTSTVPATPGAVWTDRVSAVLRARDSTLLVSVPERYTPRVALAEMQVFADSARIGVSHRRCSPDGPIRSHIWSLWYSFRRTPTGWEPLPSRGGAVGDGLSCPW